MNEGIDGDIVARVGRWEVEADGTGFRLNYLNNNCRNGTPRFMREELEMLRNCLNGAILVLDEQERPELEWNDD